MDAEMEGEESEGSREGKVMVGVVSIALLPSGSILDHFIQLPNSLCLGLRGTELACERECNKREDYRLIRLTVTDFNSGREKDMVVECRGHDAARMCNVDHAHGWEKDVVGMLEPKEGKHKVLISFEHETLKSDEAAEDHIKKFMPKLVGMDAVVNIGRIKIFGLDFDAEVEKPQVLEEMKVTTANCLKFYFVLGLLMIVALFGCILSFGNLEISLIV